MIYFVTDGEYLKIGYTDIDVESRISALQVGNARKLRLIGLMNGSREDEALLHYVFKDLRVSGEWFSCSFIDNSNTDESQQSNVEELYQFMLPHQRSQAYSASPQEWTNYHDPRWNDVDISDFTNTRKRVIRTVIEHPHLSNSEISRQCNVSRPTVIKAKRALIRRFQKKIKAESSDLPERQNET